jgi:hypothetical protein
MRRPTSFLLLGLVLAANAAGTEIWRWKDASGQVHYSDSPVPGAERVQSIAPRPSNPAPSFAPEAQSVTPPPQQPGEQYTRCVVLQPANDETFFAVNAVAATIAVEPALQDADRIQVFLNGALYEDWPMNQVSATFANLYRGSYSVTVRVVDENGAVKCSGPASVFHVQQPSLLSPQRPRAR